MIFNDAKCNPGEHRATLSLTACDKSDYTCNNGLCIPLDKRCDGRPDCKDKSDEIDCGIVVTDDSYKKSLTPPHEETVAEELIVNVSVNLLSLSNFDAISGSFEAKLTVSMSWKDKRLNFRNLRNRSEENTLSNDEKHEIWSPVFVFTNTKSREVSSVDKKTIFNVAKKGEGTKSEISSTENVVLFSGSENPINKRRFYNYAFECDYLLEWYPFDYQHCSIEIKPKADQINFVDFHNSGFRYSGPMLLMQYEVKSVQMLKSKKILKIEIVIGRRLLSIVLTTFAPTVLLNIIGHMSNYFTKNYFDTIITLNVTVMLVLTTMFVGISAKLPETSYIKMIDLWLILSLLKPFLDIIIQTYIESVREDLEIKQKNFDRVSVMHVSTSPHAKQMMYFFKNSYYLGLKNIFCRADTLEKKADEKSLKKKMKHCDRIAKIICPFISLVFASLFWIIGLVYYNSALKKS